MSGEIPIAAIALAAGRSSRMGSVNKLLREIDGVPMVRRVVKALIQGGLDSVTVVTGFESDNVRRCIEDLDVNIVHNPNHFEGMGSSISTGARSVNCSALSGILVCLGDLPYLRPEIVANIVQAFLEDGAERIVLPMHKSQYGHPVIFPARFRKQLESLTGDEGARRLFSEENTLAIEVEDSCVVHDLDTLDD